MRELEADWGAIQVRGARANNLRDISMDIPKRRLTVFTGASALHHPARIVQILTA